MCIRDSNKIFYPIVSLSDLRNNQILYTYVEQENHYRLTKVAYNGASVEFQYQASRPDPLVSFIGGLKTGESYLLAKIISKLGSTALCTYSLSYKNQNNSSVLSQIDYSASGQSLNPIKLYYGEGITDGSYDNGSVTPVSYTHLDVYKRQGEVIALRNIARIYNAKQDTDSAIYYYQSAYEKALLLNDQSRIDNVLRELSSIYIDMGKYDLAKDLFSKVSSMKNQANIYFGLGCIYESYKQIDSALYYFEKANEYGNIYMKKNTYRILSKIKNQEGDRKLALNYAYKCIELSDSIKNQTKTEAVAKVNSLYKYQHTEKENVQLKIDNEKRKIRKMCIRDRSTTSRSPIIGWRRVII